MTYPIPLPALDDRLGWIGTSGSGKTYNAAAGVERLLGNGARVVIVDPLDVWWGLRLKADGSPSPYSVVIFGGAHGDLPLNENAGALIGETVAGMAESCIVSLGGLNTKAAERRFMLAFLDAIYRHTDAKANDPYHIIFDEADLWAPQRSSEPMLQSRMEEIVRRGRIKGFIPWLITQRPAVLSKDVLSQVDGLVAFKLTASQDRKAIGDWVKAQADEGQWTALDAALPTMQRGQGVVWVPARGILETETFPPKATFDSSRTPKRGERQQRRDLKPLNLEKLKGRLASIEEEARVNNPKALKAEVARLTRDLSKAQRAIKEPPPPPPPVLANQEAIDAAFAQGEALGYSNGLASVSAVLSELAKNRPSVAAQPKRHAPAVPRAPRPAAAPVVPAVGITSPQQRILNALAWWKAFGIEHPTNEQVGFVAGYSPGSGNFNNLKGQIRSMGLLDYPVPGAVALTSAGEEKAEAPMIELTQEAFHARVRAKLSGPQLKLFDPILAAYPDDLATQEVADAAGYSAGSGNFNNLRGQLRTIGLINYPQSGYVRAADWLFP